MTVIFLCQLPTASLRSFFISEYLDHVLVAAYKMTALVEYACILEPAFLHHPSRSGIADEMVCPDVLIVLHMEAVVKHQPQRFGAQTLVPKRLSQPIAHLAVVRPDADIAGLLGVVADATYGFPCLLENNGPSGVIVEEGADDLYAFLYRLVRRPSCTWSHVRVRRILEENLSVCFRPSAKHYSVCLHDVCRWFAMDFCKSVLVARVRQMHPVTRIL